MDSVKNLGRSAAGMFVDGCVEKAALYILNPIYETEDFSDKALGDAANDLVKKLRDGASDNSKLSGVGEALNTKNLKKVENFGNDEKGAFIGKKSELREEFIKIPVQYNPETIRIYSLIGKQQEMNKSEGGMNRLVVTNFSGKTRMSFDLIFDDCDIVDAFMLEGIPVNVSGAAQKVADMAMKGGLTHSVRKRMDAILSLLSSLRTQQVVFAWAKMTFRGALTTVNNKYTMFNTDGNPIRGTMHLEITQETTENNQFVYDNNEWEKAFKTRFADSDSVGGASGFSKVVNNSILNLNI